MPIKESAIKTKIIRDEVARQVNDVNAIIKDLLARKVAELKAQNPEGVAREQEQQADYGQLYNNVQEALDNLKTDITTSPSSETVRQVKLMLNDIVKKFKGLSTSSIKAVLDLLFNFIPYTKIKNNPKSVPDNNDSNYTATNSKNTEIRRLIRDLLLKFVHDNSIKYLGADLYPKTYDEAVKYFNLEDIGNKALDNEVSDAKSRDNLPSNVNKRNQIIKVAIKHLIDNPEQLADYVSNDRASVIHTLRKFHAEDIYDPRFNDYYNDVVNKFLSDELAGVDGPTAVTNLAPALGHIAGSAKTALKRQLRDATATPLTITKKLLSLAPPATAEQVLDIMKIASNNALRANLATEL